MLPNQTTKSMHTINYPTLWCACLSAKLPQQPLASKIKPATKCVQTPRPIPHH